MKLGIVALAGLAWIAACDKKPAPQDWKERSGTGFTVMAPFASETMPTPAGSPVKMTVYSYLNTPSEAWQVQIADVPEEAPAAQLLANMAAHVHSTGTLKSEQDVKLGEGAKDFRYVTDVPPHGRMYVRVRVVVSNHHLYQVMVLHRPDDTSRDADADRFVDSFKLTL